MSRLILYYDGILEVTSNFTPSYVGGRNRPLHIDGMLSLEALKLRIIRALRRDSTTHSVVLKCRIRNNGGYTAIEMEDDEVCEYVLVEARSRTVIIYVEFKEILRSPPHIYPEINWDVEVPSHGRLSLCDRPVQLPFQLDPRRSVCEEAAPSRSARQRNIRSAPSSAGIDPGHITIELANADHNVSDNDFEYRSMDSRSSSSSSDAEDEGRNNIFPIDLNDTIVGHGELREHAQMNVDNLTDMNMNNEFVRPIICSEEWDATDIIDGPTVMQQRMIDDVIPDQLYEGMIFSNKSALQFAVTGWSIINNVEFIQTSSNKTRLTLTCAQHKNQAHPCLWRLHAAENKRLGGVWKVSSCRPPHACVNPVISSSHRNCTSKFICHFITAVIRKQLDLKPREIISRVEAKFDIRMTYMKAWDARRKALNSVFGSYAESYSSIIRMMAAVSVAIPGTVYNVQRTTDCRFKSIFWSFGPSIQGWQYCRPVLSLDGTFLLGKYRGTMLAAVGFDANGGLYPLAFAIVEAENNETWYWFLITLQQLLPVTIARSDLCFISDRHSGIVRGCREIFPNSAHRHCLRHLRENFKKAIRKMGIPDSDAVCDKMYWAGNTDELEIFNRHMNDIKNIKPEAYDWLISRDVSKWALSHDGGARYGIMTTNSSECFNGVLRRARGLPIQGLIMSIYYNLVSLFQKRSEEVLGLIAARESSLAPRTYTLLRRSESATRRCPEPLCINNKEFQVFDLSCRSHKVEIISPNVMTCTCNKPALYHIPCVHCIVVAGYRRWDHTIFVSPYYSLDFYKDTYTGLFHVIPDKQYWPPYDNESGIIPLLPPAFRRRTGRPRTARIRNTMDEPRASSSRMCSFCRNVGHNSATCPHNPSSSRFVVCNSLNDYYKLKSYE